MSPTICEVSSFDSISDLSFIYLPQFKENEDFFLKYSAKRIHLLALSPIIQNLFKIKLYIIDEFLAYGLCEITTNG